MALLKREILSRNSTAAGLNWGSTCCSSVRACGKSLLSYAALALSRPLERASGAGCALGLGFTGGSGFSVGSNLAMSVLSWHRWTASSPPQEYAGLSLATAQLSSAASL